MDALIFLLPPFMMCFFLTGIHCYLGLHVLAREIIFIDLALAQVAAFGTAFAYLLGYEHNDVMTYLIALLSTLSVSVFLAYANRFRLYISQEALIGILFALASAALILLLDQMSHGAEHLKHALVGQLLWVSWTDVGVVGLIYSAVGWVHFKFRKPLLQSSFGGGSFWVWDLVFYGLFSVVITCSVQVAGVLLVFSLLVVPAFLSAIFLKSLTHRLISGWLGGITVCAIGLYLSYVLDLPAGALIVVCFTVLPVLIVLGVNLGFHRFFWQRLRGLKQ